MSLGYLSRLDEDDFVNLLDIVVKTNNQQYVYLKHKKDIEFFKSTISGEIIVEKGSIDFEQRYFKDHQIKELLGVNGYFMCQLYIEARNRAERKVNG